MDTDFVIWLIEFQIAAFIVLFIAGILQWKLRPGAGRIVVGWISGGTLSVLACWLAIPDRPVVSRLAVLSDSVSIESLAATRLIDDLGTPAKLVQLTPATELPDFDSSQFHSSAAIPQVPFAQTEATSEMGEMVDAETPEFEWRGFVEDALVWVWIVGFSGVIVWNVIGRLALWQVNRKRTQASKDQQSLFDELKAGQIHAALHCSDSVEHAIAVGILKPSVLIPRCFKEISPYELRSVLTHELAHIPNRDQWLLALFRLLGPIVSIQPLYWLVRRRVRESQEFLADQAAAAGQPVEYAELLVQWAKQRVETVRPSMMPIAGMLPLSQTGRRVMALVDEKLRPTLSCPRRVMAGVVAAMVLVTVATAGLTIRPESAASVSKESMQPPTAKANAIVGRVIDATGKPVVKATVLLRERAAGPLLGIFGDGLPGPTEDLDETRTDHNGDFDFKDIDKIERRRPSEDNGRSFDVIAFADGQGIAHAIARNTESMSLQFPSSRTLEGKLVDAAGEPVSNAKVRVVQLSSLNKAIRTLQGTNRRIVMDDQFLDLRHMKTDIAMTTTDSQGLFSDLLVPNSRCIALEARHPEFQVRDIFYATTDKPQENVKHKNDVGDQLIEEAVHLKPATVSLARGATVHLQVLLADGTPAANFFVDPGPVFGDRWFQVDDEGKYVFRHLPAGDFHVSVQRPSRMPYLTRQANTDGYSRLAIDQKGRLRKHQPPAWGFDVFVPPRPRLPFSNRPNFSVKGLSLGSVVKRTKMFQGAAVVKGKVINDLTGEPEGSVQLVCTDQSGVILAKFESRSTGEFFARCRPTQGFVFAAQAIPGYSPESVLNGKATRSPPKNAIPFQTSLEQSAENLVVRLKPKRLVKGRCVDSEGNPLPDVDITVDPRLVGDLARLPIPETLQKVTTNSRGEFQLQNVFSGSPTAEDEHLALAIQPDRKLAAEFRVERKHTRSDLEVVLLPMESVTGRIVAKNGSLVEAATVKLIADSSGSAMLGGQQNRQTKSGRDGQFRFEQLIPGVRYFVQASHPGFQKTDSLAIVKPDKKQLTVEVKPLEPIVTLIAPSVPSTRGMTPQSAFKLLAAGMPGKYLREDSTSYEQYLLNVETWGRALRELAKQYPRTEVAFEACTRILDTPHPHARGAHPVRAIQRQAGQILLKDFIERKELASYVVRLIYDDRLIGAETAKRLIASNPNSEVIGLATLILTRFEQTNKIVLLKTVRDKYGEIPYGRSTLGEQAETAIRVKKYYSRGSVPRDIVGETLDGKTMKLSDYKGKVIVIWFWGTWSSGDDRVGEMMQRLSRISNNLKDKPFQVLGVAMDAEDTAKQVIDKYDTKWPSWFEGQRGRGEINKEWGVGGNRLILIGANGKILDPQLTEYDLARAITAAVVNSGGTSDKRSVGGDFESNVP